MSSLNLRLIYLKSQHVFPREENPANFTPETFILGLTEDISLHAISQEEKKIAKIATSKQLRFNP